MRYHAFFLVGALLLGMPALGAAATLRVPKDHATIQAAVDAAGPGDKIVVKKGTYAERVVVDGKTGLRIIGKGKPVIDGESAGTTITIRASSGVQLSGLVLERGDRYGVFVDDSSDITVRKCAVRNADDEGIQVTDSTGVTIKSCRVEDTGDHSVELRRTSNSAVQGNRLDRAGDDGISMWTGTGNLLVKNRITDCGVHGIALDGEDNTASRNTIRNAGWTGIMVREDGNTVVRNKVVETGHHGISLESANNMVEKCAVKLAGDAGIRVQDGSGNSVEKCTVSGSMNDGLLVRTTGNEFVKNKMSNSGTYDVRSTVAEASNGWVKCKYGTSLFP